MPDQMPDNRYRVTIRADEVQCLEEGTPMPQRIEMLTLAMGVILQGRDRVLDRLVRVDFVDGIIEMFVRGNLVRGLRFGKVHTEVTLVDDDGRPITDDRRSRARYPDEIREATQ